MGDLVKHTPYADKNYGYGIITYVNDSHRQTTVNVLFSSGLIGPIWEKYLEVLWNGGHISWILSKRLDLVDVTDRKRDTSS